MKKRMIKAVTAGIAVLLTAVLVSATVINSTLEVEAADTFLGIQNLIEKVDREYQENQKKYTVLEIVPDRNAAEIGYYFDGMEPALSTWDGTENRWKSWLELLGTYETEAERIALIEGDGSNPGLKKKLMEYYVANGFAADLSADFSDSTKFPVTISGDTYAESATPAEGFEKLSFPGANKTGWFVKKAAIEEGYRITFLGVTKQEAVNHTDAVYYQITSQEKITDANKDSIDEAAMVYWKNEDGSFSFENPWKDIKETLPSGASNFSLPGRNRGNEETVSQNETEPLPNSNENTESGEPDVNSGTTVSEGNVTNPENLSEPGALHVMFLTAPSVSGNTPSTENEEDEEEGEDEPSPENLPRTTTFGLTPRSDPSTGGGVLDQYDYYVVTFEKLEQDALNALPEDTYVYYVNPDTIEKSATAEYDFHEPQPGEENLAAQEYTLKAASIYCKIPFKNQEWFKKYALNMEEEQYGSFPVEVLSYTSKELNDMLGAGQELPDFDFLSINSGARVAESERWSYADVADVDVGSKKNVDLSSAVCVALFNKVQSEGLPCLVDGNLLFKEADPADTSTFVEKNDAYENLKLFKLCTLFIQRELPGLQVENADAFDNLTIDALWTQETLAEGYEYGSFTTDQVYCLMDTVVHPEFGVPTIYRAQASAEAEVPIGFQKVFDEIALENLYRSSDASGAYATLPTDISRAIVVRHILNYQNRRNAEAKRNLSILEIQPAMTPYGNPTITLDRVRNEWGMSEVESVDVKVMTTGEFIGKVETLNDKYDVIYIGTCTDHMNTRTWGTSAAAVSTAFNDSSMDGLVYYHTGDMRFSSMYVSGLLDSEYPEGRSVNPKKVYYYVATRYNGNDITKEKKEALFSYLDGSYPIVVSEEFFEKPVTLFKGANYTDERVNLEEGEYELSSLGISPAEIASLKVKAGYQVIGYNADGTVAFTYDAAQPDLATFGTPAKLQIEQLQNTVAAPVKAVNGDVIDNSSYMYEFANQALSEKRTNFFSENEISDSTLFRFYLNRPKATLVNTSANGTMGSNNNNQVYFIQPDGNGRYFLQYRFTIQNEGAASSDTRYQCKFYVDVNADGKFSGQEELGDIQITGDGNYVAFDQLYAGREYVMTREVPDGYKGVLPWKVEISQVNNSHVYCFMDGYTKLQGTEKEEIRILQISRNISNYYSLAEKINGKRTVAEGGQYHSVDEPPKAENYQNSSPYYTLVYGGTYSGVRYDGISSDFEIDVDFMTAGWYEKEYSAGRIDMSDYNMLILGFSDEFDDISGAPLQAIVDFINSGKSVLLSHDTACLWNYQPGTKGVTNRNNLGAVQGAPATVRTYNLTKAIRALVGMDRYGVTSIDAARTGIGLEAGTDSWNVVASTGKDMAYVPKSNRTQTTGLTQGLTYVNINGRDKGTNKEYSEAETGIPGGWTNTYLNLKYSPARANDWKDGISSNDAEISNGNGELGGLTAVRVNAGQITEYPYALNERFTISRTHAQYYQLDFSADDDQDGQSDLVVWYCLDKFSNGNQSVYSMSPKDVSNNYYIYNKGNITYTGMGHSAAGCTVDEAKLFINTMIAAYHAGIQSPSITIQENGNYGAPKQTVMYRYFDGELGLDTIDAAETEQKIYFTVRDVNFVKGTRKLSVKVFYDNPAGNDTIKVDGTERQVTELPATLYDATTNGPVDANNLTSGGIYYVKLPMEFINSAESGWKIYLETYSTIESNGRVQTTDKAYADLEVLRAYLLDLK